LLFAESGAVTVIVYGKLLEVELKGPTIIWVLEMVVTVSALVTVTVQPVVIPVMVTYTQSLPPPKLPVSRLTVFPEKVVGFVNMVTRLDDVFVGLKLMVLHVQAATVAIEGATKMIIESTPKTANETFLCIDFITKTPRG
jgi:hypothetical protein